MQPLRLRRPRRAVRRDGLRDTREIGPRVQAGLLRELTFELVTEPPSRDLTAPRPARESPEASNVVDAGPWRPRVERKRRPEPAAGEEDIEEHDHAGGQHRATRPRAGQERGDRRRGRGRSDTVVVLVEPDARRASGEREREPAVVDLADGLVQEGGERPDDVHGPAALARDDDDRRSARGDEGGRDVAWGERDPVVDGDRAYRRRER